MRSRSSSALRFSYSSGEHSPLARYLIFAVAALFLNETLGPTDIAGVVIVAAGILAVQLSKQQDGTTAKTA